MEKSLAAFYLARGADALTHLLMPLSNHTHAVSSLPKIPKD